MTVHPELERVIQHILASLRRSPVGASSRFALSDEIYDLYPALGRDEARSVVGRALAAMQESESIDILRAESWDLSGDERVRLHRSS